MKLNGEHTFQAPRAAVWEALMDPEVLAKALPGGDQLEKVGDNEYKASLKVKVGPVQGKFDGGVELTDVVELESYTMLVNGKGAPGFVKGSGSLKLSDDGDNTHMTYEGDVQVGGRIASVGQRLVQTTAKSMIRQGLGALDQQIQARVAGKSVEEIESAGPSAVSMAGAVAADVTKEVVGDVVGSVTGAFKRFTGGKKDES